MLRCIYASMLAAGTAKIYHQDEKSAFEYNLLQKYQQCHTRCLKIRLYFVRCSKKSITFLSFPVSSLNSSNLPGFNIPRNQKQIRRHYQFSSLGIFFLYEKLLMFTISFVCSSDWKGLKTSDNFVLVIIFKHPLEFGHKRFLFVYFAKTF